MKHSGSSFDQSVCHLVSRLFGLATSDDALQGPYFDRPGLLSVDDWHPRNAVANMGAAEDRRHRSWKYAAVGGYVGHLINYNGGAGINSRDDLTGLADYLPITVSQASVANAYVEGSELPFSKFVGEKDEVDLSEWMRFSRAEELYSLVVRPPDFEEYDRKPYGYDNNTKLLYAQIMFGTQFARREFRRSRVGSPTEGEDSFAVYMYGTSKRKREEDQRRPLSTQHPSADMRSRKMLVVGDQEADATRIRNRTMRGYGRQGAALLERAYTTYDFAMDRYMVPALYKETHVNAFAAHEPRMYELEGTQKRPKVIFKVPKKEPEFKFAPPDSDSDVDLV
eukprot:Skav235337  [mRNA]  locus=scaffold520:834314:835324:+ [translate_table: standard]